MNAEEARKIAEAFIATQEMRGFVTEFAAAHKSLSWPDSWTLNFELRSPSVVWLTEVYGDRRYRDGKGEFL